MAIVVHIITGLNDGGAEAALFRLCSVNREYSHHVISLMDKGKYGEKFESLGISVDILNMPQGRVNVSGLYKLFKLLRILKPEVVQTWMYHADLLGGVIARLAGIKNISWGIHHSNLNPGEAKKSTIYIARLCSILSYVIPRNIICCAEKSVKVHSELGYCKSKLKVIYNGYDLNAFNIDSEDRELVRREFNINDNMLLLGMVSRFHPFKDHKTLVKALGILKESNINFKCILVGQGMTEGNGDLNTWFNESDVSNNMILAGTRNDIAKIMNALDLHILSSSSEAFPNVLNEAMACGTLCVTTDVGDAAFIVGNYGWVSPSKQPQKLAEAIFSALEVKESSPEKWQNLKLQARTRIKDNFTIDTMVKKYNQIWSS